MSTLGEFQPPANWLAGRRLLITGATGVLGRALSLGAARAGAELVLLARRASPLGELSDEIVALGAPQPMLAALDFAKADAGHFAQLAEALAPDGLHGLVLNAAAFAGLHPLDHLKPQDWQRGIQANLTAPGLLLASLLPMLKAADDGRVVAISDPVGREHKAFWNAYGVAKAGLDALIGMVAQEAGQQLHCYRYTPPPLPSPIRSSAYPGSLAGELGDPARAAAGVLRLLAGRPLPGHDCAPDTQDA